MGDRLLSFRNRALPLHARALRIERPRQSKTAPPGQGATPRIEAHKSLALADFLGYTCVQFLCARQVNAFMYIERRFRVWFALHTVPPRLRKALGKARFAASLKTEDRPTAERRAAVLKAQWLSEMAKARTGNGDHVTRDAEFWRIKNAPEEQRELMVAMLADEAQARVEQAAAREGIRDEKDPRYEALPVLAQEVRFVQIATGQLVPFAAHVDEWIASLRGEKKSARLKRGEALAFAEEFQFAQDVERKAVQRWINNLPAKGIKVSTIRRKLSDLRSYWSYLVSIQVVPENNLPLEKLALPKNNGRATAATVRSAFEASDVVKLLAAAEAQRDPQLADLIRLGMWTGARIGELCSLRVEDVKDGGSYFVVASSKTQAGVRQVPVHSQLKPTIDRRAKEARGRTGDPYLIGDQPVDQFGDRSRAIGKRFGRLKTNAGFGPELVFHSIRKTVATLLENAGVAEGVAADILGHEKHTITYGLYSGGSSMQVKRGAIEKVRYPRS